MEYLNQQWTGMPLALHVQSEFKTQLIMVDLDNSEVIALVLPPGAKESATELKDFVATGTMLLIRHPDGRMSLEPTRSETAWAERARDAGCVYKSRPIHDPVSCEILGHELEMIAPTLLC
ncbi:MAG TPA: hypothetical protein VHL14_15730 [Steroidobacteraceae bacterium]|jgi:hypothetical protein|nr:hypothetical protein [Steroidobacteraceae bacterium]